MQKSPGWLSWAYIETIIGPAACVAYCCINLVLNILNGWLFLRSPFRIPLSLTVLHMASGYFITATLFKCRAKPFSELFVYRKLPQTNEVTKSLAVLGFLAGLNIALNNVSLLYINVALNQIVKAFNPVFIAISDVVLRGHRYAGQVWLGFLSITVGVVCTVVNNPAGNIVGVLFCTGSSLAAAVQTTMSEFTMTEDLKLDCNNFMYYTSLWSGLFVIPMATMWDADVFFKQLFNSPALLLFTIFITSFLAFLNNITLLLCIKYTGGTYSAVVGNVKIVLIVVVQQILWPEDARQLVPINVFGMVLTLVSFFGLSVMKYRVTPKPKDVENLDDDDDDDDVEGNAHPIASVPKSAESLLEIEP